MKKTQIVTACIHLIGWLLFLCIPASFVSQRERTDYAALSIRILIFCAYYIAFFYANTHVFIAGLYLRKKHVPYFSLIALLLIVTIFLKPFDRLIANGKQNTDREFGNRREMPHPDRLAPPDFPRPRMDRPPDRGRMPLDIVSIILFLLVWAVGLALQLVTLWRSTETRAVQAEAERARAELSFLKARINPHFLFNTLNNIYSMAMVNHERTAESVLQLSDIMRYITDDIVNDFVLLENEIRCIDNYVALQRLRLNKNTSVDYRCTGNPAGKVVAPLILMPFVENVFKYGVSSHQLSPITIKLEVSEDSIFFYSSNRIVAAESNAERSGIGISSTRQRLESLYPGKYLLLIKSTTESFTVELSINASAKK